MRRAICSQASGDSTEYSFRRTGEVSVHLQRISSSALLTTYQRLLRPNYANNLIVAMVVSIFLRRGQPDGTFFVRRKGPSLLVLTYVALSRRPNSNANTPGSGSKHRHKGPPARLSSPPTPPSRNRDALDSPLTENKPGRRATVGPEKDYMADNTTVQVW